MPLNLKDDETESFANPQPPPNYHVEQHRRSDDSSAHPMTNADFRKLLMTPAASAHKPEASVRADISSLKSKKSKNESVDKRKEKKLFYASLMKEAKEREVELSKKYRDRAKERREIIKDGDQFVSTTANFKAVAPDARLEDNAERRRQIIEESKFLGGDLEHTHLVKGLDYALLQKVKAELEVQTKDEENLDKVLQEEDDEEAAPITESSKNKLKQKPSKPSPIKEPQQSTADDDDHDDSKIVFKSKLARSIYRVAFKPELPKINELFLPRRMAYVIDLDDEETDIPVTLIRSKADCPNKELNTTLTTNDIVINKLTQILLYLRQGGKKDAKKLKKKGKNEDEIQPDQQNQVQQIKRENDLGIYDDIDDFVPDNSKRSDKKRDDKSSKGDSKKRNYFDTKEDTAKAKEVKEEQGPSKESAQAFIKSVSEKYSNKVEPKKEEEKKMIVNFDADSYAECYPGTRAEEDVNIDSDDEPDYDKMDLGSKKGPVGKWDFDTNEEYSSYMSNKEALPKAAFQYGLKMSDGRKTRRAGFDPKMEKAKLDKEWTQISKIIEKRKNDHSGLGDYKKPKF